MRPLLVFRGVNTMEKLDFYTVKSDYVDFLKNAEVTKRGFSRVPDMAYSDKQKPKFLCGIVLKVNDVDYYVPVTSFKQQMPDNFLIVAENGSVLSSLRFNYMFPVPKALTAVRVIDSEPDAAYRSLLSQELRYCVNNQVYIQRLAERTYKRVLLGKNQGIVRNSCDFRLLEDKCREYCEVHGIATKKNEKVEDENYRLQRLSPDRRGITESAARFILTDNNIDTFREVFPNLTEDEVRIAHELAGQLKEQRARNQPEQETGEAEI
jgi:protein AbiQ